MNVQMTNRLAPVVQVTRPGVPVYGFVVTGESTPITAVNEYTARDEAHVLSHTPHTPTTVRKQT